MELAEEMPVDGSVARGLLDERPRHPEDLVLAVRAARYDEAAWREIYDLTRERIFGLLVYQTGSREEALELLQETYVSALQTIGRFRGEGSLAAWLSVIAIRRARSWKRKIIRRRATHRALAEEPLPASQAPVDHHLRRRLHQALAELGDRQRAAFLLREMEGLSSAEIGQALGCRAETARVHCFRARKTLRRLLESDPSSPLASRDPLGASPELD